MPASNRCATAMDQFWIWAGVNTAPINWVLGALGIHLGLGLGQTIGVLVVGNLIGMVIFGFFVLMGHRTGVCQMILSRSVFGRRGGYLPAALQGLLTIGWSAVNTWIVLDLVVTLVARIGLSGGTALKIVVAALIMVTQVVIASAGFRAIARFERWTVPLTILVLVGMSAVAWTSSGVAWDYSGRSLEGVALWSALSTIMTAIGIGWGITWFAYASDFSRFVSVDTPRRRLFVASVLGQFIPTVWLGVLGASLATVTDAIDPGRLVVESFGVFAVPVLLLVLHGPIATNIVNIYSSSLCAGTLDWAIRRRTLAPIVGVCAFGVIIFLIYQDDFGRTLDGWLAGLVTWVSPWATIMLIHFYGIRRGRIDVAALFADPRDRRTRNYRWPALIAFVAGVVAAWAAEYAVPTALQGPLARAWGGIDLSWLVGPGVAGLLYLVLLQVPSLNPQDEPDDVEPLCVPVAPRAAAEPRDRTDQHRATEPVRTNNVEP
ncbi:cytosine permease [Rhodococcus cerastii]|nr:cytosine permease [Rhodococcus cerastii]